jgi:hypothetical protein
VRFTRPFTHAERIASEALGIVPPGTDEEEAP